MFNQEGEPILKKFVFRQLRDPMLFSDRLHLFHTYREILLGCLGRFVLPESTEKSVQSPKFSARHHADEKIIVHGKPVRLIDIAGRFKKAAPPETGFLGDEIA